jgi:hypothetical protein
MLSCVLIPPPARVVSHALCEGGRLWDWQGPPSTLPPVGVHECLCVFAATLPVTVPPHPFPYCTIPGGGVGSSAVTLHIKSLCFEIVRTHLPRYHRHAHLRALRRPHHSDVSIGLEFVCGRGWRACVRGSSYPTRLPGTTPSECQAHPVGGGSVYSLYRGAGFGNCPTPPATVPPACPQFACPQYACHAPPHSSLLHHPPLSCIELPHSSPRPGTTPSECQAPPVGGVSVYGLYKGA